TGEWGDPLNYRSHGMREHVITNARYWIDEFHFDGLRLDATQAIIDDTSPHILADVGLAARAAARAKPIWIVGENEPQDAHLVAPIDHGGMGLDALWNDDFEHSARVALTGVTDGYFHDYQGTSQELVAAIEHGFLYQGQIYSWQGHTRGTSSRGLPHSRFVHFLENHDQVANTGFGDRLVTLADPASYRAMTALLLLGPEIPMLFQGQETGSTKPWRFFIDHDPELCKLVRRGRADFLKQFARLATPEAQAVLPDPSAPATYYDCILDPRERDLARPHVQLHRDLLRIRRETPCFADEAKTELRGGMLTARAFCLRWWHDEGDRLLLVNLGITFCEAVLPQPLLAAPPEHGWRIAWSSEHPKYGGHGTPEVFTTKCLSIPARCAVLLAPDRDASLRLDPAPASGEKELRR
ncbi:MAG TPA: DUF3459 domain-containing protein, partial [Kofleriaceae bacterium]|nr:DUF3459 domain-containing protein [Kofleriaceae bacterium]